MGKILDKNNEISESDLIPKGSMLKFANIGHSAIPSIGCNILSGQLCVVVDIKTLEECCLHFGKPIELTGISKIHALKQTYIIYILETHQFAYYNCSYVKEYLDYKIIS